LRDQHVRVDVDDVVVAEVGIPTSASRLPEPLAFFGQGSIDAPDDGTFGHYLLHGLFSFCGRTSAEVPGPCHFSLRHDRGSTASENQGARVERTGQALPVAAPSARPSFSFPSVS